MTRFPLGACKPHIVAHRGFYEVRSLGGFMYVPTLREIREHWATILCVLGYAR